jgi:hypothetical protein
LSIRANELHQVAVAGRNAGILVDRSVIAFESEGEFRERRPQGELIHFVDRLAVETKGLFRARLAEEVPKAAADQLIALVVGKDGDEVGVGLSGRRAG